MYGEEAFKGPTAFRPYGGPEEKAAKPSPLSGMTKLFNWKIILLVIIIAVIAYWFFFINKPIRTASFNVVDSEGKPVIGVVISVLDEQGKTIQSNILSGTPIKLPEGTYKLSVDAPEGLKLSAESQAIAQSMLVSQDAAFTLKLVPDIKLSLTLDNFPEQMYVGQALGPEANINLLIENGSKFDAKNLELEIVFSVKGTPINIQPSPDKFDVKAKESAQINLNIEVPPGFSASSSGTPLSIDFKVKGFTEKTSIQTTILPKLDIQIKDPVNKTITATVKAGSLQQVKTIKVRNNGKITVKPLNLSLELDEGIKETAAGWFSFSSASIPLTGNLEPGTDYTFTFTADIPGDANLETATGFINIGNDLWTGKIQLLLTIQKPLTKLEFKIPTKEFSLYFAYENGIVLDRYEKKSVDVTLTNKGETRLLDGKIELPADAISTGCESYISILKPDLEDLDKTEKDTSKLEISAPSIDACGAGKTPPCTRVCKIQASYKNEFNEPIVEEDTLYISVEQ